MYEDIGLRMSTLPQGSVSLTFMLDHNLSLSLPLGCSPSLPPSLPPPCTSLHFPPHYRVRSTDALRANLSFAFAASSSSAPCNVLSVHSGRRPSQSASEKIASRCRLRAARKEPQTTRMDSGECSGSCTCIPCCRLIIDCYQAPMRRRWEEEEEEAHGL